MAVDKEYADLLKMLGSNKELSTKVMMASMMSGVETLMGKLDEEADPNEAEPDNDVDDSSVNMASSQSKKVG